MKKLQEKINTIFNKEKINNSIFMKRFRGFAGFRSIDPIEIDSKYAIQVKNFTKRFFKFVANKDVTFNVSKGSIHGFIGPNGSGKTTTIKTLIGAYTMGEGSISIAGFHPGSKEANRKIGYIPERASFPGHLSSFDYLVEMAILSGVSKKDARERATKTLKDLGLEKFGKRKPIKFSSGMQKKILLAQSLVNDPEILILDEPAANLDPSARKELQDDLLRIRNSGKTILISSHILSELERIIDEVTFLFYGQVLYSGKIENISSKTNGVFLKFSNNKKAKEYLESNAIKVSGDVFSEIFVETSSSFSSNKLLKITATFTDLKLISFRANDLQTIYDDLIEKAKTEKLGSQTIDGVKVVAQNSVRSAEV